MSSDDDLRAEIKKWTDRLNEAIPQMEPSDARGRKMLENVEAYRKDSGHFSGSGDLVRSFECLVWAWALVEIGEELGHLVKTAEKR